ncbi:hypothetical protein CVU82_01390 [Candidatus Falkowbacteria bacterium HGW-Falkowbacteria-1]|jgi:glycosyltransferase involved in cell wall biosynthesis|uniref:Glycosyltransferase n=1 Tax=Candidatus Falkowbacteria bacterium HGW-Falkowbacteria-1 TaxID=2013768 RepID=A0A2N2EAS2_9BACT|nr:MAG: hypothetical protein CVU82_01390 [Candidatus Falkowbacteria bacterium HGW-Falkowbacteria-1]
MRIAVINNLYKPYQKGGAEKIADKTVQELKTLGHCVFIVTTKPRNAKNVNEETKTYYLNSNYYNLGKHSVVYRLFWQILNIFNLNQALKLKKILKTEKPDLVISNNLMGLSYLSFKIIKRLGIKHAHILHDIQLLHPSGLMFYKKEEITNTFPAKIYQKINKYLASSPDLIISPSQWLLNKHKKRGFFGKSKKIVLDNPLAFTKKDINRKQEVTEKNIFNFLFIGQIEEHKGVLFLIRSFRKIKNDNIKLKIIGDGSQMEKAKEMAKNNKNITFLGKYTGNEIEKELIENDCLIVPSLCYENSPTVIYEASAFDMPIIASDLGGISELIKKYKGILFEAKNSHDLVNKINYFCLNYKRYFKNPLPQIGEKNYAEKILKEI